MNEPLNSISGSSSTAEMDTVLKLLEKITLLIGQCNNKITQDKRKEVFLGVTGTSPSQVALILKEKTAFLQKHDEALFEKDFTDYLSKSLKAKKQSIDAIAEVSKTMNRKGPFRRVTHFLKEGKIGRREGGRGRKSGQATLVNTICSKRKEPVHSNSQILLPIMINMEELTHLHPIL